MKLGSQGAALIRSFEACRLSAYLPTPDDVPTIGYGHTDGVSMGDTCTQEQAEAWFLEDVAEFEGYVNQLVKVPLTQNQFDALVSFAYNVGPDIDADTIPEGLGDSTLLRKLNLGDYAGCAREFVKWNKQRGKVLRGLTRRRMAEERLFNTGAWLGDYAG